MTNNAAYRHTRAREHAVSNDRGSFAIAPRACPAACARGAYTPGVKLHHYGLVTLQSFCHPRLVPLASSSLSAIVIETLLRPAQNCPYSWKRGTIFYNFYKLSRSIVTSSIFNQYLLITAMCKESDTHSDDCTLTYISIDFFKAVKLAEELLKQNFTNFYTF